MPLMRCVSLKPGSDPGVSGRPAALFCPLNFAGESQLRRELVVEAHRRLIGQRLDTGAVTS